MNAKVHEEVPMFEIDDDVFCMFIITFGSLFAIILVCFILNPDFWQGLRNSKYLDQRKKKKKHFDDDDDYMLDTFTKW